jgi:hypothetical protein
MVIEKFLAISAIALGLTTQRKPTVAGIAREFRGGEPKTRRRARWLRQNLGRRPGARGDRFHRSDLRNPDSVR